MNTDQIAGKWEQLKGHMQKQWGKLTDSDWDEVKGNAKILAGKLQERYGYTKEQADKECSQYFDRLDD